MKNLLSCYKNHINEKTEKSYQELLSCVQDSILALQRTVDQVTDPERKEYYNDALMQLEQCERWFKMNILPMTDNFMLSIRGLDLIIQQALRNILFNQDPQAPVIRRAENDPLHRIKKRHTVELCFILQTGILKAEKESGRIHVYEPGTDLSLYLDGMSDLAGAGSDEFICKVAEMVVERDLLPAGAYKRLYDLAVRAQYL